MYKLYSKNTSKEPAVETVAITTDGSITLPTTSLNSPNALNDGDKIYYKIWIY